jgi:hypothetical protein
MGECCGAIAFENGADFGEFIVAGGAHGKRVQGELRSGAGEEAVAEVFEESALHGILRERCAVHVRAVGFIAHDEALGGHDLEELEDGGVAGWPFFIESFVNVPHGGRFLLPEDLEEREFGFRGAGDGRTVFHDVTTLYEVLRKCQRKSS